jgi:hypothetical protein
MRTAASRIRADQCRFNNRSEIADPYRKSHRISQYPPSKYAFDRAIASGGIIAMYASVAASALN